MGMSMDELLAQVKATEGAVETQRLVVEKAELALTELRRAAATAKDALRAAMQAAGEEVIVSGEKVYAFSDGGALTSKTLPKAVTDKLAAAVAPKGG